MFPLSISNDTKIIHWDIYFYTETYQNNFLLWNKWDHIFYQLIINLNFATSLILVPGIIDYKYIYIYNHYENIIIN